MGRPRKNPLIPTEGVLPLEENPFNKTLETPHNNMSEENDKSENQPYRYQNQVNYCRGWERDTFWAAS